MNPSPDRINGEDRENKDHSKWESSIRLPLKAGRVTGLPKDPASAPAEIRLSSKLHEQGRNALEWTRQSGDEWGFFIHFDETGRLLPGEVMGPSEAASEGEWITLNEYLLLKRQDKTIHGHLHTHPESPWYPGGELTFSEGNIGLFLEAEDVFHICKGPTINYLILLRTQRTDLQREGIGKEAIMAHIELMRKKVNANIMEGMERKPAINQAASEAMIEICKKYNIALYKGEWDKAAQKMN